MSCTHHLGLSRIFISATQDLVIIVKMRSELAPCDSDSFLHYSLKSAIKSRNFKSKGGIIVLLLEIFVLTLAFCSYDAITQAKVSFTAVVVAIGVGVFLFPLSGWLGDAILGRYKAVKYTVIVLWVSTMVHSILTVVVDKLGRSDSQPWKITSSSFQVVWLNMYGSFIVNSFHLGTDQVMDAPSWQVSSFASWYCWAFFLASIIKVPFSECLPVDNINALFASFMITIALCMDLLFNRSLVKEPTSSNSLKLIFQVLRYTVKNKYPRLRSAFSYWDEKKYRINLAKAIYGGPFTSEEVENVKTFLRIVAILIFGCFFLGHFVVVANSTDIMFYHYSDKYYTIVHNVSSYSHCLIRGVTTNAASYLIVLCIPLFECIINPFFWKYMISLTTSKKFVAGMVLLFVNQCNNLALEVGSHAESSGVNMTIPCLFNSNETTLLNHQTVSLSFYWLALPKLFSGVAYFLMFTSTAEFMCAQSPYSMKGLLIGVLFSFLAVAIAILVKLREYFRYLKDVRRLSCGTWYFMFSSALIGLLIIVVCLILKWYSRRRRRDNVQDETSSLAYSANYRNPKISTAKPYNYYM